MAHHVSHRAYAFQRKVTAMQVYTLLVEVGRKQDDGLPEGCDGAALLCYTPARDEAEAVRETVAILKDAGLAPLDISGHGTPEDREEEGHEIGPEERELMQRALDDDSVVIAQMQPHFPGAKGDPRDV
ncbi:hypothetical protein Q4511_14995 [Paracoccus sp. 1_MG-2023]|nr:MULTISPECIES: hypothetical protein [unclassified Paracoccus (in: a-proteobacteria)]MBU2956847.1 hypothetical protein [Paracoccus sp. C2R09]MDO6670232.1 hypothetical protein [Paracoccus sp. 1_MG-2023]